VNAQLRADETRLRVKVQGDVLERLLKAIEREKAQIKKLERKGDMIGRVVKSPARSSPKARNEAGALAVALLDPFRVMRLGARTSHLRTVIMERLGVGAVRGSENARVA
jgi:hypothetical protein